MTNLVATYTPAGTRSDNLQDCGVTFTYFYTGDASGSPDTVTSLGAWKLAGNTGNWIIRLVDAANTTVLATATISMAGATTGAFNYAAVTPVALTTDTVYKLVVKVPAGQTYNESAGLTSAIAGAFSGAFSVPAIGGGTGSTFGTGNMYAGVDAIIAPGTSSGGLISSLSPITTRTDNLQDCGLNFTYTGTTKNVTQLGAFKYPGNTGNWIVRLANSANTSDLTTATIAMGSAPVGFNYAACAPVSLVNGTSYKLIVKVPTGQAYTDNAPITSAIASALGGIFQVPASGGGTGNGFGSNNMYGGVDLLFTAAAGASNSNFFFAG